VDYLAAAAQYQAAGPAGVYPAAALASLAAAAAAGQHAASPHGSTATTTGLLDQSTATNNVAAQCKYLLTSDKLSSVGMFFPLAPPPPTFFTAFFNWVCSFLWQPISKLSYDSDT